MKTFVSSLSLASLLLVGSAARAQDPEPMMEPPAPAPMASSGSAFGQEGQIAFDANLRGSFGHQISSFMGQSEGTTSFSLNPSLLYFVAPNIAVGGAVGFAWISDDDGSLTSFAIGPAAAYHVALTDKISLLPGLFLAYVNVSAKAGGQSASGYQIPLGVNVPLLFHLAPHLFLGAGPGFSYTLVSKVEGNSAPKQTNIGLVALIGGYL